MGFGWFKKSENKISNDFSDIDSNEKAMELFQKGKLVRIFLMPLEFGGVDGPMNSLYVPEFVHTLKSRYDAIVEDLLAEGKELGYSATPEYKGKSFIPSKLMIEVTGEPQFSETINIW